MDKETTSETHAAEGAALGFWYQSFYALRTLVFLTTDDAAIGIEQLDDIQLKADGRNLLYQLKHSIRENPAPITIKSKSLWRTMKVWIDVLPSIVLSETTLHLIAVGAISSSSPLLVLTEPEADRSSLMTVMTLEAERVVAAREAAARENKNLPFADRAEGCVAFLGLSENERLNLLRRAKICPDSPTVSEIEKQIADHLQLVLPSFRSEVARRLVEWWDRQVVYTLCGKRERVIGRAEIQAQIMTIVSDLEQDKLVPEFETVSHPEDYQPDGMLARQIELVKGEKFDLQRAIREEWRAREQRARWLSSNPAMAAKITNYDFVLREYWSDKHAEMVQGCEAASDDWKCESGLRLLRWTHNDAPMSIRPIASGWDAAYYVRGSYQVLAINLTVGWHPDYLGLLGDNE